VNSQATVVRLAQLVSLWRPRVNRQDVAYELFDLLANGAIAPPEPFEIGVSLFGRGYSPAPVSPS
jgi:hypothetical protein